MSSIFKYWQPIYAAHGIATYPVEFVLQKNGEFRKKPMVGNYGRMGLKRSAELISREKFAAAQAIGFTPGVRSNVTILDVDEPGDRALERAIARHGDTPIIVESTATKKHHLYYQFNGEKRIVRPEKGVEADILGHLEGDGNLVVAAPSLRPGGEYRFFRGSLDDFHKLPFMRNVPGNARITSPALEYPIPADFLPIDNAPCDNYPDELIAPEGIRNKSLWTACMRALARSGINTYDDLLAFAQARNSQISQPSLEDTEVQQITDSAWRYQQQGRNWFGRPSLHFFAEEAVPLIDGDIDLFRLVSFIRATQGRNSAFMLANGMCERWGWSRQRFSAVRARAVAMGEIYCVRQASQHAPALYRRSI
jgi:hypothetical protein